MKPITFAAAVFLSIPAILTAQISPGDPPETVAQQLGDPVGTIETGDQTIKIFDRGPVTFQNEKVVSFSLIPQKTAEKQKKEAETTRRERIRKGNTLLAQARQNQNITGDSAEERFAFWKAFQQKFPEIDVDFELSVSARQKQAAETEAERESNLRNETTTELASILSSSPEISPNSYYHTGFPLFFNSPNYLPPRQTKRPDSENRFQIRRPPPPPPTIRQKTMPLQNYGFLQNHRQPNYSHPHKQSTPSTSSSHTPH